MTGHDKPEATGTDEQMNRAQLHQKPRGSLYKGTSVALAKHIPGQGSTRGVILGYTTQTWGNANGL